jgi:hypothetical protein
MVHLNPVRRTVQGVLLALLLSTSQLYAASLPPAVRGEIEGLLSRLAASGCQFKRNGSWHTAEEAQAHLRRKLDYLVDRGAVASTEQFIERAATQSSISGKPYQVQCNNQVPVASSRWLLHELRLLRAGAKH